MTQASLRASAKHAGKQTTSPLFCFVLQPEFPLYALVLATEALRVANQNSGKELFRWHLMSEDGQPVRASNGTWTAVDLDIAQTPAADFCFVFQGNLPSQRISARLLSFLRSAHRAGCVIGAVDTGAFALTQARIDASADVVVHWEAETAFRERFPQAHTRNQLYLISSETVHCAGGIATLDMMLELIGRLYNPALSTEVANALVHTPRAATVAQRESENSAYTRPTLADRVLKLMESNLDFPLALEALASHLGVSRRTLTRECERSFGESPMRLYLRIRLQAARNLLFYEEFPIRDIALACGFSYPSVLSRTFKTQFGTTPREFRAALRRRQSQSLRPEIRRMAST